MQDVAVDACCLINLLAAGQILSPAPTLKSSRRKKPASVKAEKSPSGIGLTLHVPATVTEETLYLLQPDDEDETELVKAPIDLAPFIQAGLIHSCDLQGEKETELFVQLATRLDDGEAACFAIAHNRGWLLATDDRPARKLATEAGLTVITTPELVKRWADVGGVADEDVAAAIQNIQTLARFVPRPHSPGYT